MEPAFVGSIRKVPGISQVLISMVYLPEAMPASFQAIYTPVESAGTEAQIKHLARLMATQMTAAGLGPGECRRELTRAGVGTGHWALLTGRAPLCRSANGKPYEILGVNSHRFHSCSEYLIFSGPGSLKSCRLGFEV